MIIAKNVTGASIACLGVIIPAASQRTLSDRYSGFEISTCEELQAYIAAGDIVINDGTSDLSIMAGLAYTANGYVNSVNAEQGAVVVPAGGFTPVYGGWHQTDDSTPTTDTTVINTDYTLASGVITAKAGTTGLTVETGGGLRNTSGETVTFLFNGSGGILFAGSVRWFDVGCHVRQSDDVTFDAMIVGDHVEIAAASATNIGQVQWRCFVTLKPNETVYRAVRRTTGAATTVSTRGGSATMERIA